MIIQANEELTSPERPKSAPYLRLKNSKRTSKCQVFSSTVPCEENVEKNRFFFTFLVPEKSHSAEKCKRDLKKPNYPRSQVPVEVVCYLVLVQVSL